MTEPALTCVAELAATHGGSNTNSFALIWVLPDRDFAAVALANTGASGGFPECDEAIQQLILRYARPAGAN